MPIVFPNAYEVSSRIDKEIFNLYYNLILNKQEIESDTIKPSSYKVLDDFKIAMCLACQNYLDTPVDTLPDIDNLIMHFLEKVLLICHSGWFQSFFESQLLKNGSTKISITWAIKSTQRFSPEAQYAVFEMLLQLKETDMYPLEFLFNIANSDLLFAKISEEWANDFLNRACSPLFYDIINRFFLNHFSWIISKISEMLGSKIWNE